jgi:hypothetical protein
MSIEEKFKNRAVLSEVLNPEKFKHLNLNGIDCIQETWESNDETWIWVTFCKNEVEGIADDSLIDLFLNFNPNLVFEWIDDEGEEFTYLLFNLIADNSEHQKIKKEGTKDTLEVMGPEDNLFAPNPQTKGTIKAEELLKPGKFYKESDDDERT